MKEKKIEAADLLVRHKFYPTSVGNIIDKLVPGAPRLGDYVR